MCLGCTPLFSALKRPLYTRRALMQVGAAIAGSALLAPHAALAGKNPGTGSGLPDTIFVGGPILTMADADPYAEAVAVRDDKILAVGRRADVMALAGPGTTVVDLAGRTLMPGFVEPHLHLTYPAMLQSWLNLDPFSGTTYAEMLQKLQAAVQAASPGEWVQAWGFDPFLITGAPQELTSADLNQIAPNNPIFVLNLSGHVAYVNTKAFEATGITAATPNPPQGTYVRDANGDLTGVLYEPPALGPFIEAGPKPSPTELATQLLQVLSTAAAAGCTTINDAGVGLVLGTAELDLLTALANSPAGAVRLSGFLDGSLLDKWSSLPAVAPLARNGRMQLTMIKYWADGSTQAFTAALQEPYLNTTNKGNLNYTLDELQAAVAKAHELGWQVAVHCNGDASLQQALDVFDAVLAASPAPGQRNRIEHCTVSDESQIERMASLDLTASHLMNHLYYWGTAFRDQILGPERTYRLDPAASSVRLNIPFSLHCDLITTPIGPLSYVQTAVTRKARDGGEVLGPDQRVSVEEALKAITIYPAWQLNMDDLVGSLEAGKQADFTILAQDPRAVDPDSIGTIQVLQTWVAGVRRYDASTASS